MRFEVEVPRTGVHGYSIIVAGNEQAVETRDTVRPQRPRHQKLVWGNGSGVEYTLLCPVSYFRRWTWTLKRGGEVVATAAQRHPGLRGFFRFETPYRVWDCGGETLSDRAIGRLRGVYDDRGRRVLFERRHPDASLVVARDSLFAGDPFAAAGLVIAAHWGPWRD